MKVKMVISKEIDEDIAKYYIYITFAKMNGHAESTHEVDYHLTADEAIEKGVEIANSRGNEVAGVKIYKSFYGRGL